MPADSYRFHPAAEAEFIAAAEWYDAQRAGLGEEFAGSVRAKIASIMEAPQRWRLIRGTRRVLLGRFPYALVYREMSDNTLEIVAVAHLKRHPTYWSRR